jgi:hypothetical protein
MKDLDGDSRGYDSFDAARLLDLGRKYSADYAVVPGDAGLALPKLYDSSGFAVYRLTPGRR